jgi:hypothetical protein
MVLPLAFARATMLVFLKTLLHDIIFFETRQKKLPFLLIKKKRVDCLINGKPAKNPCMILSHIPENL